jgi:hypothetical protein
MDGTIQNLSNYGIKSIICSLASGCKNVKTETSLCIRSSLRLLRAGLRGFSSQRTTQTVWLAGKDATVMEDVEDWFDGGGDGDEDRSSRLP